MSALEAWIWERWEKSGLPEPQMPRGNAGGNGLGGGGGSGSLRSGTPRGWGLSCIARHLIGCPQLLHFHAFPGESGHRVWYVWLATS